MKVLVTGGAGFIGSRLVEQLLEAGNEVTVLDNLSQQIHGDNPEHTSYTYATVLRSGAKIIIGDIRNRSDVAASLTDIELVYHLASETGTGQSMYNLHDYCSVNELGFAVLLEEIVKSGTVKRVVLTSSRSIYGEGAYRCFEHGQIPSNDYLLNYSTDQGKFNCPYCQNILEPVGTSESCQAFPKSFYAITKFNQEQYLKFFSDNYGIDYQIYRLQNVYGVGQSLDNPYTGILSIFSKLNLSNQEIMIFEDGQMSRDFVNVRDVVNILMKSLETLDTKVLNIGTGQPITVMEVMKFLHKAFSKEDLLYTITGQYRKGDIRHNFADLTALNKEIGSYKFINFQDGVKEFTEWVKNILTDSKLTDNSYSHSLKELYDSGLLIDDNEK